MWRHLLYGGLNNGALRSVKCDGNRSHESCTDAYYLVGLYISDWRGSSTKEQFSIVGKPNLFQSESSSKWHGKALAPCHRPKEVYFRRNRSSFKSNAVRVAWLKPLSRSRPDSIINAAKFLQHEGEKIPNKLLRCMRSKSLPHRDTSCIMDDTGSNGSRAALS